MDINKELDYPKGYRNSEQIKKYHEILEADELIKIVWDQDGIYEINFYTRFWVKYNHNGSVGISSNQME